MLEGAQLIRRIVQGRLGAFRFDGVFLKPGKIVSESSLWPAEDWPRLPHLIEIFPSSLSKDGHGGSRIDVILWKYESGDWREVCRLDGYGSSEWMLEMEPIVTRSLNESRVHVEPPDVRAIADELAAPILARLAQLETREQREALATELHTRLMTMACAEQSLMLPFIEAP
jgi:hypothetical protein